MLDRLSYEQQEFPRIGGTLRSLRKSLPLPLIEHPAYVYVVTTVELKGGNLHQTGSAPNLDGGRITLCTCKHKDRASPPPVGYRGPNPLDPWAGIWVAGLCSATIGRPRALFYLMLIEQTFDSHIDLWHALSGPTTKSAARHPLGDIYEPLPTAITKPCSRTSYQPHLSGHVHDPAARVYDIESTFYGRHPRLLLGDQLESYIWNKPNITLQPKHDADWSTAHHRFFPNLGNFLAMLK